MIHRGEQQGYRYILHFYKNFSCDRLNFKAPDLIYKAISSGRSCSALSRVPQVRTPKTESSQCPCPRLKPWPPEVRESSSPGCWAVTWLPLLSRVAPHQGHVLSPRGGFHRFSEVFCCLPSTLGYQSWQGEWSKDSRVKEGGKPPCWGVEESLLWRAWQNGLLPSCHLTFPCPLQSHHHLFWIISSHAKAAGFVICGLWLFLVFNSEEIPGDSTCFYWGVWCGRLGSDQCYSLSPAFPGCL